MFNSTFKRTALAAAIAMTVSGAALAQDTSSAFVVLSLPNQAPSLAVQLFSCVMNALAQSN